MERKRIHAYSTAPFDKFTRRHGLDDRLLQQSAEELASGLHDAKLGNGLYKKRIPRPGSGKSGGFRSIVILKNDDQVFFLVGFAKNEQDNIDKDELNLLKQASKKFLELSTSDLELLISNRTIRRVSNHEDET